MTWMALPPGTGSSRSADCLEMLGHSRLHPPSPGKTHSFHQAVLGTQGVKKVSTGEKLSPGEVGREISYQRWQGVRVAKEGSAWMVTMGLKIIIMT